MLYDFLESCLRHKNDVMYSVCMCTVLLYCIIDGGV